MQGSEYASHFNVGTFNRACSATGREQSWPWRQRKQLVVSKLAMEAEEAASRVKAGHGGRGSS